VTRDLGGTSDSPNRILRAGTKLLLGVDHYNGSEFHLGVVRLLGNGAVDTGFGDQGLALSTLGQADMTGLAVQGDGKVVAAGDRGPTQETSRFLVARFLAS
jgi:hypothetical protein